MQTSDPAYFADLAWIVKLLHYPPSCLPDSAQHRAAHPPSKRMLQLILAEKSPLLILEHIAVHLSQCHAADWVPIFSLFTTLCGIAEFDPVLEGHLFTALCHSKLFFASLFSRIRRLPSVRTPDLPTTILPVLKTATVALINATELGVYHCEPLLRVCSQNNLIEALERVLAPELVSNTTLGRRRLTRPKNDPH